MKRVSCLGYAGGLFEQLLARSSEFSLLQASGLFERVTKRTTAKTVETLLTGVKVV